MGTPNWGNKKYITFLFLFVLQVLRYKLLNGCVVLKVVVPKSYVLTGVPQVGLTLLRLSYKFAVNLKSLTSLDLGVIRILCELLAERLVLKSLLKSKAFFTHTHKAVDVLASECEWLVNHTELNGSLAPRGHPVLGLNGYRADRLTVATLDLTVAGLVVLANEVIRLEELTVKYFTASFARVSC